MDAAAAEADVKLYKASAELLAELQAKLPLLLRKPNGEARKWVLYTKTTELARLLDSFQEWPQLLDPILVDLVEILANGFLSYCVQSRDVYHRNASVQRTHIEPLPRAICRLLYVFCKVRGYKVIIRLLNNEPKYIEPLLVSFRTWSDKGSTQHGMSWEERYIMLLWLSHLMLAPFRLDTISAFSSTGTVVARPFAYIALPEVARVLLGIALEHFCTTSKDSEAASALIVRLALREDMQKLDLPQCAIEWCIEQLLMRVDQSKIDQYRNVGLLTLLYSLTNSSTSTEIAPFAKRIFSACKQLATDPDEFAASARQSAPARKLLIKIMRSAMLHTLALADAGSEEVAEVLEVMLEDGIQVLIEWLADTDTPVRQAASKALGMIVLKLDADMGSEVVEAVLGCLNENVLLEDRQTGQLTAATDLFDIDATRYKKNVNAVHPLRWHGAMLTLGHVLFRRSPPPEQLSAILDALLMGLQFEQRSNVGTSLGVSVRDAACFGIWSLARKYTTQEIEAASLPLTSSAMHRTTAGHSTLQVVATELVVASCLDPSGNLRRGASAALQELIGRHPDTIRAGISVVQQVDYHAVARRSRALLEVSTAVSSLDEIYRTHLLYSLLDWRGCRAVDAESRGQAAKAVGALFVQAPDATKLEFAEELLSQIDGLKETNVGVHAAARHGLLSSFAAIMRAAKSSGPGVRDLLVAINLGSEKFIGVTGALGGRVTADLVNVLEATSRTIAAVAHATSESSLRAEDGSVSTSVKAILERCTTGTEDDLLCTAAAEANVEVFKLLDPASKAELLQSWLPEQNPKQKSAATCKGRIASISRLVDILHDDAHLAKFVQPIATFLAAIVSSNLSIETKVNAMNGISTVLKSGAYLNSESLTILTRAVVVGLGDYTVDQRGDIGSWLRLASIEAVRTLAHRSTSKEAIEPLLKLVVRLAAEKLTKVRFAAWNCLETSLLQYPENGMALHSIEHQSDASSTEYFSCLMVLLKAVHLRDEFLQGLVGSIAGGSEDISQAANGALVSFLDTQDVSAKQQDLEHVILFLLRQLQLLSDREDREVVPVLETLCMIREQFSHCSEKIFRPRMMEVCDLVDALQTPIADITRIQALIRLLLGLSAVGSFRLDAADRISRKLLHKWPRVRQAAADAAFMLEPRAIDVETDWNASAGTNKVRVVELRKALGVAGRKR